MPHLFMDGIELEVPEGTLLIFNPTSLPPTELHAMKDVQFHAGGIIFQTKTGVHLPNQDRGVTNQCFPSFHATVPLNPDDPLQIHYQISADPQEQEAFKLYPMIFDFVRQFEII